MHIVFEELSAPQRAGGIEAATRGLITALEAEGVTVVRRFPDSPEDDGGLCPEVVHVHGIWSPPLMRRFRYWRKRGVPCVVTVHGMLEPWALAHKRLKKVVAWHLYQKRLLNQADALHATSAREADNLRKLGLKPRIEMIPWGVGPYRHGPERTNVELGMLNFELNQRQPETSAAAETGDRGAERSGPGRPNVELGILNVELDEAQGEPSPGTAQSSSSKFKIQNSKFKISSSSSSIQHSTFNIQHSNRIVLFVGRIYPVKGLPMLVDAWAKVRPGGWRMKIVGPDEAGHLAEVTELVRKAGLEAEFEFTGALEGEALERAYCGADLLIAPSHTENFGMSIAEALAHGIPVITTQGAPWKLLEEEGCGWWVPISTDGIAAALHDATERNPEALAAMGARGRKVVAERFSWSVIARRFVAVYRRLLS